jgi:hypothetical protein
MDGFMTTEIWGRLLAVWLRRCLVGLSHTAVLTSLPAHAAVSTNWSAESPLPHQVAGSHCAGSVGNNMVVTSSGRLYVFYSETISGSTQLKFATTDDRGLSWSSPQLFRPYDPMPPGSVGAPSVSVDSNDVIHCAWRTPEPALYYARYDTHTDTWSHQQVVTSTPRFDNVSYSQVMADRAGRVHLFWHDGNHENTSTPAEVWYAQIPPGTTNFSTPVMLSADDGQHSAFPTADLSGVTGNLIAIAWRNAISGAGTPAANWDIQLRVSPDGGTTWLPIQTAAGGSWREWDPQLAVDRHGVLHLAYHQYDPSLNSWVYIGHSNDAGTNWHQHAGATGFQRVTPDGEYHLLSKSAYDFAHDIVWFFWKRQYRPGEDILGTWVLRRGQHIETGYEYLTDLAPTNAAGFHNFAVGADGVVRASYQIGAGNPNTQATIYYRDRLLPPPLAVALTNPTLTNGTLQTNFDSEFAVSYQPEISTNLTTWTHSGTATNGTGEAMTIHVPVGDAPHLILRLRCSR